MDAIKDEDDDTTAAAAAAATTDNIDEEEYDNWAWKEVIEFRNNVITIIALFIVFIGVSSLYSRQQQKYEKKEEKKKMDLSEVKN